MGKLLAGLNKQKEAERQAELYRKLLQHEAQIGGTLFGPVPRGGRREFFCLDEHTWVWHEEWKDQDGQVCVKTTRYDVRPNGILKVQDGVYRNVGKEEGLRLFEAAQLYRQRVFEEIYTFAR